MSKPRRNGSGEALPPRVLQIVGIVAVVCQAIFWAFTDRIEPTLLVMFGGMIGVGQTLEAITRSRELPPPPPAPPVEPAPVARVPRTRPDRVEAPEPDDEPDPDLPVGTP